MNIRTRNNLRDAAIQAEGFAISINEELHKSRPRIDILESTIKNMQDFLLQKIPKLHEAIDAIASERSGNQN